MGRLLNLLLARLHRTPSEVPTQEPTAWAATKWFSRHRWRPALSPLGGCGRFAPSRRQSR